MKYALCSNRPWHCDLPKRLQEQTGHQFAYISTREELTQANLQRMGVDVLFFPHWSWIIPEQVYEQFECVIFHMTDLPYGRGGSPLQNLIVRGHDRTMISALRCTRELDAGDIYLKRPLALLGTAQEIFLRATDVIGDMIAEIVRMHPVPVRQTGQPVLFSRRKPADGNWSDAVGLGQVFDYIRMLDAEGYPPAFVEIGKFRLEFTRASLRHGEIIADVRITRRDSGANE